jgi:hypothetical protein
MPENPYEPPSDAPARTSLSRPFAYVCLAPPLTAISVFLINQLFLFVAWLIAPPPRSSGTVEMLAWYVAYEVFNLPGLVLFLMLDFSGQIPQGEADTVVRHRWHLGCSMIAWAMLSLPVALGIVVFRRRPVRTEEE